MKLRILRLLQLLCIGVGIYLAVAENHIKYFFYGIIASLAVQLIRFVFGD